MAVPLNPSFSNDRYSFFSWQHSKELNRIDVLISEIAPELMYLELVAISFHLGKMRESVGVFYTDRHPQINIITMT